MHSWVVLLRRGCRRHFSENICHRVLTIDCLCNGFILSYLISVCPSRRSTLAGTLSLPAYTHDTLSVTQYLATILHRTIRVRQKHEKNGAPPSAVFTAPSPSGIFPILFPPSDVAALWNAFRSHDDVPTGCPLYTHEHSRPMFVVPSLFPRDSTHQ